MEKYDVVVLGAGPGGYVAAIRAAQLGATVAVVEKNKVGGTCLNVGCIPTKALLKNAEILHNIKMGKSRGIKIDGEIVLDLKKGMKAKDKAVKQLVNGVSGLLDSNGVVLYQGEGVVKKDNIIEVSGEANVQLQYKKLIIATGSSPKKLPIEGIDLDGVMTSEEMLSINHVPERLVIVGGGVIGCEFATIFSAYGSQITIVEMLPEILMMQDKAVSSYMRGALSEIADIKTGMQLKRIEQKDGALSVVAADADGNEESIPCDNVLVSIGRKPNSEGTDEVGLDMEKGFIKVDDTLRTSNEDIYAIGDVTGKRQLAHVASEMGVCAAENAMGASHKMDLSIVPGCIYTIPEVGAVGLTEKEAKEQGYDVLVGNFPIMANGKAVATGVPEGMFKVIADQESKKLLGAHLVGRTATEIVAEMAAYLKMGATVDDVIDTIHAHPTISESAAEAARDIYHCTIHMPKK